EQGFTWEFAPIPSHNGKPIFTRCPNNTIACYARTPHPAAAYTFAAFMSGDEAMQSTRAVPSRVAGATGSCLQRTDQHNWALQVESLTDHLKIEPRTPYFETLNRALDDTWHSVLDGVVNAQTAIND